MSPHFAAHLATLGLTLGDAQSPVMIGVCTVEALQRPRAELLGGDEAGLAEQPGAHAHLHARAAMAEAAHAGATRRRRSVRSAGGHRARAAGTTHATTAMRLRKLLAGDL